MKHKLMRLLALLYQDRVRLRKSIMHLGSWRLVAGWETYIYLCCCWHETVRLGNLVQLHFYAFRIFLKKFSQSLWKFESLTLVCHL